MGRFALLFGGLSLVAAAAIVTNCQSKTTGNEGNLQFSYWADDDIRDFNKPIAVGAMLELIVEEAGTGKNVSLTDARSEDPSILEVVSFSGNRVILRGTGGGSAEISVTATVPNGNSVTDSVNMLARVPEVVEIKHTCTDADTAYYLAGTDIVVAYEFKMSNGQNVIGYGYHPVDVTPADALTLDQTSKDQIWWHYRTTNESGVEVKLNSQLDDSEATLITVTEGDIDGAKNYSTHKTLVDTTSFYYILPTVGDVPVCQAQTAFTVETATPEVCEVTSNATDQPGEDAPKNEWGWVKVKGLTVGNCEFTITHTNADGGAGVTTPFMAEIVEIVGPEDETPEEDANRQPEER